MSWHVDYINSPNDLARGKMKDSWTRDYAGPYATRAEASARAQALKKHGAHKVRITQRWGR